MAGEIIPMPSRTAVSLAPQSFEQAIKFAEIVAKSDLVPKDFANKPGNVLVAVQMGAELGLAPMQALQNIAVVNGRPAVWGDAALALVRASGLMEYVHESVTAGVATCRIKRRGEPEATRTFSEADAKRANLWGKGGPWTQYPQRMLQLRARAFALRDVFPDVLRGLAVGEEARDIPAQATAEIAPQAPVAATVYQPEPQAIEAEVVPQEPAQSEPAVPSEASWLAAIEGAGTMDELESIRHDIKSAGTPTAAVAAAWSKAAGRLRNGSRR